MAVGNILIISYPLLQVFNVFHFQPFFVLGVVVLCSRVLLVGWLVVVVLFLGGLGCCCFCFWYCSSYSA